MLDNATSSDETRTIGTSIQIWMTDQQLSRRWPLIRLSSRVAGTPPASRFAAANEYHAHHEYDPAPLRRLQMDDASSRRAFSLDSPVGLLLDADRVEPGPRRFRCRRATGTAAGHGFVARGLHQDDGLAERLPARAGAGRAQH